MRISFVIPMYEHEVTQIPIGELTAATILKQLGHYVTIVDARVVDMMMYNEELSSSDLIFLSTSTYDFTQCYGIDSIKKSASVVSKIRRITNKQIYAIGAHGTILPEATLNDTHVDGVVRGEFETNVVAFVSHFSTNGDKRIFPSIKENPLQFNVNSSSADYSLLQDHSYYSDIVKESKLSKGRCALIFGNRGCPYSCNFCFNMFGALRYRMPEVIVKEVESLYRDYGYENYFFLDYTFTANHQWVEQLCKVMSGLKINLSWICQTRCDCVSPKSLELMNSAGCKAIWFGVENVFSESNRKYRSLSMVERAISDTKNAGVIPILFLQFMLPHERRRDVELMIEWVLSTKEHFAFSAYLPRPGTILFSKLAKGNPYKASWSSVDNVIGRNIMTLESPDMYEAAFVELRESKWYVK